MRADSSMLNVRATRPARRVNWVEESYAWRPETSSGGDEPLLAPRVLRGLRPQRMELLVPTGGGLEGVDQHNGLVGLALRPLGQPGPSRCPRRGCPAIWYRRNPDRVVIEWSCVLTLASVGDGPVACVRRRGAHHQGSAGGLRCTTPTTACLGRARDCGWVGCRGGIAFRGGGSEPDRAGRLRRRHRWPRRRCADRSPGRQASDHRRGGGCPRVGGFGGGGSGASASG
jgi:hypothetical protein